MRKILLLLLLSCSQYTFSQLEIVGSKEYGRIVNLIYDPNIPNKIYACSGGNHIVESKDNGVSWSIYYAFPNTNFKQIDLLKFHNANEFSFVVNDAYSNNNNIYILNIATKEIVRRYSIPIPAISDESTITSYDFYNDDTVIVQQIFGPAGSRFGKVYYTNNRGTSWDMIYYNINYGGIFPNSVAIAPNNPQKVFIARIGGLDPNDYGGLFISEDAGQTWEEQLSGIDFGPIVFHPNDPNHILLGSWLGSSTQNLYRSIDGGDNWSEVDANWSNEVLSGIFDIQYNPLNHNNVIALGLNEIVRTYDGFLTKEVFAFPNQMNNPNNYFGGTKASFNPFNPNQILIANNDYPLISNDGGATVTKLDNPFFFSSLGQLNLFKNSSEKHLYYSVQNGYSHRDLNTQAETSHGMLPLQIFPFTNNKFYADPLLEGRMYGFYSSFGGSGLSISNDHGTTSFGIPVSQLFMHTAVSKPENPNIVFGSFSDDFATTNLVQFDISDTNNIQQTSITLPRTGLISDMLFNQVDSSEFWIGIGRLMYKTNDNGQSWNLFSDGLTTLVDDDKIYDIDQNPVNTNQLSIATSKGIFTSLDNGGIWSQISTFECHSIKHSNTNNNHIVAITFDFQQTNFEIRYSVDAGVTWQQVPIENLSYVNCDMKSAAVDFNGNIAEIYIATFDLGVLKYSINLSNLSNPIFNTTNKYSIYPNPAKNSVSIKTVEELNEIVVFDVSGKKVTTSRIGNNSIDISTIETGLYFIKAVTKKGEKIVAKFIKN